MDVITKQDQSTNTDVVKKALKKKGSGQRKSKQMNVAPEIEPEDPVETTEDATEKKIDPKTLKKKLMKCTEENQELSKNINEKNKEIIALKRSVNTLNEVINSVPIDELRCNSSIATSKIVDLSNKNRQLKVELENTKTRIYKKDAKIEKLELELKLALAKVEQKPDDTKKSQTAPQTEDVQNKLSVMQQKYFEMRNKNIEMQNQLKVAQKCLQQEVGEDFTIGMAHTTTRRGRAQTILHLQQKLQEMRQRMQVYEIGNSGRISSFCNTANVEPSSNSENGRSLGGYDQTIRMLETSESCVSFEHNVPMVRKTEIIHRAKVEALESEISSLNGQLEDQRAKVLALKVRNKTLSDEVFKHKMKASSLEEQTDYHDVNLASMHDKINSLKSKYETRLEDLTRAMTELSKAKSQTEFNLEQMSTKVSSLEELLRSKDEAMDDMNEVIRKLEEDLKAISGEFLFSCRELRKEEFISILDTIESEKNQLVKHNKSLNERLNQERSKNENLILQLSKQKIRISRLEVKIRDLEKELDIQNERKKRSQRIADYANSISATSLNNSISSFTFENTSMTSLLNDPPKNEELTTENIHEMKNQLDYAQEKIALLEDKITLLSNEKDNDAKVFEEIMLNSKQIILDTILDHKNGATHEKNNYETQSLGTIS